MNPYFPFAFQFPPNAQNNFSPDPGPPRQIPPARIRTAMHFIEHFNEHVTDPAPLVSRSYDGGPQQEHRDGRKLHPHEQETYSSALQLMRRYFNCDLGPIELPVDEDDDDADDPAGGVEMELAADAAAMNVDAPHNVPHDGSPQEYNNWTSEPREAGAHVFLDAHSNLILYAMVSVVPPVSFGKASAKRVEVAFVNPPPGWSYEGQPGLWHRVGRLPWGK